jgi:N-acetylglucosaminyldiphosphoundecaprenol N-acetyl-beta-D-mannosaminyltransferase
VLDNAAAWRGSATQAAVQDYQPAKVLTVAYANYRKLGQGVAKLREAVTTPVVDESPRQRTSVVGALIDLGSRDLVRNRLMAWAGAHQSRTVCFCNVHSVVQASFDERHRLALLEADHVAPDGAPIAWTLRFQSGTPQERVDGPGTMLLLCADAQAQGVKVGLYGASPTTLQALVENLKKAFPRA